MSQSPAVVPYSFQRNHLYCPSHKEQDWVSRPFQPPAKRPEFQPVIVLRNFLWLRREKSLQNSFHRTTFGVTRSFETVSRKYHGRQSGVGRGLQPMLRAHRQIGVLLV
jgi:hypothetical protein